MKIPYLLAALSVAAITATAQDASVPTYMVLTLNDGSYKAMNVETVGRIVFDAGNTFKATDKSGASLTECPVTSLSSIDFTDKEPAGIASVEISASEITFDAASSVILVNAASPAPMQIFDLKGNLMLSVNLSAGDSSIDISDLLSGIYLVRYADSTLKISKK